MLKKISIILIMILLLIGLISNVNAETAQFSFDENSITVILNGSKNIYYSGGTGAISWSSEDTSIATVEDGSVKGLKIGETTITATRGTETATCKVKVVYNSLQIGANESEYTSNVNLILGEHDTENLFATVKDYSYEIVNNAEINWKSSDNAIVTIDATSGKMKALKSGTATITAEAAGVEDTCKVTVYDAPIFTDFKNAKYETSFDGSEENLKISGITPKDTWDCRYYFIVTSSNTKPELAIKNGYIDEEAMEGKINYLSVNAEENYLYTRKLAKYTELKQDLYLWIIEEVKLQDWYYDTNGNYVSYSTKFAVEGKKLEREVLPQLNLILQSFNIGYWTNVSTSETDNYTYINFNFPSATENRKFTLKIGKITDKDILTKIKNNDYSGIVDLLSYAKNNEAIYSKQLTTTSTAYFKSDEALFDGRSLLENETYYFIYVEFDDENGKYYPIEGVTLGQAWFSTISNSWDLWAYTSSDFKWDNLSSTYDSTIASGILPKTGTNVIVVTFIIIIMCSIGTIIYKKYNNYKNI